MQFLRNALALGTIALCHCSAQAQRVDPMKMIDLQVNAEPQNVCLARTGKVASSR